ncbi:zinc-binding dehydrogenase [Bordetella sp. 02P26C-1]|nr:zinc-binding dehydrogenase [Bordetella sp. 02P26C-1]
MGQDVCQPPTRVHALGSGKRHHVTLKEMQMKAVLATPAGAVLRDLPTPTVGAGQLLVRVHAAALNRADLRTLQLGENTVLGMEWAGEVVAVAPDVTAFRVGDRVMCSGKAAFAEYAVADVGRTMKIPAERISYREASSVMLALQTMHDAIVTHGRIERGDRVLIHGAASSVGLTGAKIARACGAGFVMGTSRDPARRAALLDNGFDAVLDSDDPRWPEQSLGLTAGDGFNVIVDQVAGARFNDLIQVAAILGRIVNVGRLGGATGAFDFETHAVKRLSYIGVTFRTRSSAEIQLITERMHRDLSDALDRGELSIPLDREFALADAAQAYERMKANLHFGKITLRIDQ